MSSDITWSLKGIDSETREAAKMAARKSGLTLGEWFNRFIQQTIVEGQSSNVDAIEAKKKKSKSGKKASRKKSRSAAGLEELLSRLSDRSASGHKYAGKKPSKAGKKTRNKDALASISLRLEASENHALDAVRSAATQAVYSRLGNFDEKISSAREDLIKITGQVGETGNLTIEKTLGKVIERLEASEKQNNETARAMQKYLLQMVGGSQSREPRVAESDAADFLNLEERVSQLAQRIGAQKS